MELSGCAVILIHWFQSLNAHDKRKGVFRGYHSDPEILGGPPVFVGTRVPVQSLFDHLEAGQSIDDFIEGFPSVRREQVIALLERSRQELLRTG